MKGGKNQEGRFDDEKISNHYRDYYRSGVWHEGGLRQDPPGGQLQGAQLLVLR
ncbi:MAG: hypothetical protein V3V44_05325 [Anaerolineales bacterium]